MAIRYQFAESALADIIILPLQKNSIHLDLISKYTDITYDLELQLTSKEVTTLHHPTKKQKLIILGLGDQKEENKASTFFRSVLFQLKPKSNAKIDIICGHLNPILLQQAVVGTHRSQINFGVLKTGDEKDKSGEINLIIREDQEVLVQEASHLAESIVDMMAMVDYPSNLKTPQYMADYAVESGKKHGFDVEILDTSKLEKLGMGALLSVGQGSVHPPLCIVMEYKPTHYKENTLKLGLVGKGISFDTGGISIKPSANLAYMKCDMAGAAAVIGTLEAAAKLKLDVHLIGVVPAAENAVDANSIRPGDVISSYSGKSIEIIDTDAEGRLVLADGLSYMIKHYQPQYLIDLATLTGSCVATLGSVAAGLFTHDDELANILSQAGEETNEKIWRLPLWEDYASEMNSDIADIKNLSGKPVAGAITAAKFLEFFTDNHLHWAHLDIAGVAFTDSEFAKTRTATGFGVRLLTHFIRQLILQKQA